MATYTAELQILRTVVETVWVEFEAESPTQAREILDSAIGSPEPLSFADDTDSWETRSDGNGSCTSWEELGEVEE